jgi:shikimate kinase
MHAWVGFPYEETHAERAKLYFETEIEVMQEIVDLLSKTDRQTNIVIDTSGSAIYTPPSLMEKLSQLTKMIYLAVTPEMINMMLNKYLQKPVAVLWNGMFEQREGETITKSFARCYPKLLSSREDLYRKYSHQIIGPEIHRSSSLTVQSFIETIH